MSVVVKGLKIPKTCGDCPLHSNMDDVCRFDNRNINYDDAPPCWCPLVEVPEPHGDLIDREILEQELRNGIRAGNYEEGYEQYAHINNMDDCVECVRYADTVIEAERRVSDERTY